MLKVAEIEAFRQLLVQEKQKIQQDDDASQKDRRAVELDQQSVGRLSRMDAMQMQAMAQASSRRRSARISRINAALARMDEDEFGFCQDCGDDIGKARLELDPTAPSCVSCAKG